MQIPAFKIYPWIYVGVSVWSQETIEDPIRTKQKGFGVKMFEGRRGILRTKSQLQMGYRRKMQGRTTQNLVHMRLPQGNLLVCMITKI